MRKKLLSLCMALALCLSLLPATALAAAPDYQVIYVGGVKISSTGYWTTDSAGTVTAFTGEGTPADNFIYYDASRNTLTLHNATIRMSVSIDTNTLLAGAAIGVLNQYGDGNAELTITLEGTNTIAGVGKGIYVLAFSNSTGDASLTITSESGGSLDASARQTGIWVQSNSGNATLTIRNAKVEATGTSTAGYGVNVQSSNSSTAALTVDGGSLTASGNPGILYDSSGSGTVPNTTTLTIRKSAIVDAREGGIGAGYIVNLSGVSPTDDSVGIVFGLDLSDSKAGAVYGDVTLQENLTIGEDESLTIPDGASLTIPDGASLTIGNDATLTNEGTVTTTDGGTLTNEGTINNSGTLPDDIQGTAPPRITTTSLAGGTVGTAYTATLAADGEPTSWTWSAAAGSNTPPGLTLNNGGTITGTPTAAGTYSFTVTATNDYGSDSKEFTLTIDQQGTIHVTSVSLDKTTLGLTEGGTDTLTTTVEPNNATNKNVTWESSNKSVATVDANGLVTAVSAGTATITVTTADSNFTDTCTVTVTARTYNISATPETLDFGSANAGYTAPPTAQTVSITNTGNQTITLTQPTATNFDIGTLSATELAADETATFTVQPKTGLAAGNYNETLAISGDHSTSASITVSFTVEQRSSGGGPTTYAVTAPDAENGTVRVSPGRASRGTTVTITVTPDEGYELESLTVLDSRDNEITLTDKGDGKYTFTMPSGKVTVEASFAEIAPEPLPFGDVDDGDWFADAVRFVYENGMMNGVSETSFAPHATTSRSMIVTILYRLEGKPVVDYAMDFTDVAGDAYYAEAVRWAASEGIVGGYGGGLFGAEDAVAREQLAVILYRYAVYKGYDVSVGEDTNILSYADFADLSEYAIPAMQWACGAGVITGVTDATLVPQGEATRAQVAAMLMRFVEAIG